MDIDTLMGVKPTAIADYMLNPAQVNTIQSSDCTGFLGSGCDVRYKKQSVNDESALLGLDKPLSRNIPYTKQTSLEPDNTQFKDAGLLNSYAAFEQIHTREKRPTNTLSEITIDRFEKDIFHNPQDIKNIVFNEPNRGGLDSRMATKDAKVRECGSLMKITN